MSSENTMTFIAEIKRTSQRKTSSLDNVYQLVLETNNGAVLDLGKLSADIAIKVTVEVAS